MAFFLQSTRSTLQIRPLLKGQVFVQPQIKFIKSQDAAVISSSQTFYLTCLNEPVFNVDVNVLPLSYETFLLDFEIASSISSRNFTFSYKCPLLSGGDGVSWRIPVIIFTCFLSVDNPL